MSNQLALATKDFFSKDTVKKKFEEIMGKRATQFITSVLQIVASNELLSKATPESIYHSAMVAATLDLPLNNNLGFAYIVPYNAKQQDGTYKQVAQFQMGYKGFIQLALRSGQFHKISSTPIYEGQIKEADPLKGYTFDFTQKKSDLIIGYAGYFRLSNGFEATLYMTVDELKKHGTKYSQTFKKGFGLWKDDFEAMASKTVLKLLLAKFAPLSIEMQRAVISDQAIINDETGGSVTYVDHEEVPVDKIAERAVSMIQDAETVEELIAIEEHVQPEQKELFETKKAELNGKRK